MLLGRRRQKGQRNDGNAGRGARRSQQEAWARRREQVWVPEVHTRELRGGRNQNIPSSSRHRQNADKAS